MLDTDALHTAHWQFQWLRMEEIHSKSHKDPKSEWKKKTKTMKIKISF